MRQSKKEYKKKLKEIKKEKKLLQELLRSFLETSQELNEERQKEAKPFEELLELLENLDLDKMVFNGEWILNRTTGGRFEMNSKTSLGAGIAVLYVVIELDIINNCKEDNKWIPETLVERIVNFERILYSFISL